MARDRAGDAPPAQADRGGGEADRGGDPHRSPGRAAHPGVNDDPEQVRELVDLCAEAGATHVTPIPLHLRGEVKDIWFDWLRENRPELLGRYAELYGKRAYLRSEESKRLTALVRPRLKREPGGEPAALAGPG